MGIQSRTTAANHARQRRRIQPEVDMIQRVAALVVVVATICPVLLTAPTHAADAIDSAVARARVDCTAAKQKAVVALLIAFDEQVKLISQTGELEAVEALRSQKKAFLLSQTLPTATPMQPAVT